MGGNSSKNRGARADQGWLIRSLSRSWSMPPVPSIAFSKTSTHGGGSGHLYGKFETDEEEEEQEQEERERGDDGPGEVINPGKPRPRARESSDSWEIVEEEERQVPSIGAAKPRKRARSYSKSVSLPHHAAHSRSIDLVHGLPLVLEEEESPNASLLRNSCEKRRPLSSIASVKRGLFYGASLEPKASVEESPRNRAGAEMVSPSSSLEDWCIVGPRKMERLDEACGGISRKNSGKCLRDKTNFVDHRGQLQYHDRDRDRDHLKDQQQQQQQALDRYDDRERNGLDIKQEQPLLDRFERKCPPGGESRVVLYVTSLQGIRKTYEQCRAVRTILEAHFARIDERDVAMHAEFRRELRELVGPVTVPRLFVKGRHVGGAEEAMLLNENGLLRDLLDGVPKERFKRRCEGCGGARFVPCGECGGSCKVVSVDRGGGGGGGGDGYHGNEMIVRCYGCNENGLVRCPMCF